MRRLRLIGLMVAFFGASYGSLLDYAGKLPECGLTCTLEHIPLSACKVVTNDTCICSDEKLRASVETCLFERCERMDAIDVARLEADACKRPIRNRKVEILAPIVIQVIGLLMVPLRLYARWTTVHRIETDDWIVTFCALVFIVFVFFGQLAGWVAFGEDIWMVKPDKLTFGLKIFFIDESLYLTCLGLTKISVLFFYLRIFPNKSFRYATYATMSYIGLSTTILLFLQIFQCIPFSYNWDGWKGDFGPHHCLNINVLAFVAGGLSISHDVIILFLPIPLLWHLNMGLRSKIGIFIMFSLGIFILVTSCVRLRYITLFTRSLNPTWDFTDPLIWSGVEVSVSMIVVCLPTMRILLKRTMPRLFTTIASLGVSAPKKPSNASSRLGQRVKSIGSRGHRNKGPFDHTAAATGIGKRSSRFFSQRATSPKPNESDLELGDKMFGEVRTQIRFGDVESSRRRGSMELGIHVRTTTTFGDTGEVDVKPLSRTHDSVPSDRPRDTESQRKLD
ncbi:CFEM domain-containing protein [Colletotrichum navitas]|uniref:CFEM domain-containing protein n=1 Tax=Colletotrichum navitas TaxID=681940 RepID=A0AAD8V6H3_9PEZI|nr:CFEM domain-containing protein [Colletotrichum navitas]KAK1593571.1 CFEM domain-containing protein [Colletotrichum navitas]